MPEETGVITGEQNSTFARSFPHGLVLEFSKYLFIPSALTGNNYVLSLLPREAGYCYPQMKKVQVERLRLAPRHTAQ